MTDAAPSRAPARDGGTPPDRNIDLLQAHPVATLIADAEGRLTDANQAAEILFNKARGALIGSPIDALLGWPADAQQRERLASTSQASWAYGVELAIDRHHSITADIASGPDGTASGGRIVAIHPVPRGARTPFGRPGAAARSAAAAAAMLAHEIKNPLSGIRGAAQLLGRGTASNAAELSRLICGEVDRIAGLIDGMQGFTRGQPLPSTSINIYPAIGQARGIATQGFAGHVAFSEDFDPSLPRIAGNHDALVQILINIIKNAAEALDPDAEHGSTPRVRITTAYRHGLSWDAGDGRGHQPLPVELAVHDNGPGVPDHLVDALFDPFVSTKRDGQGLGLALVDKLVRDMGGVIQHDRVDGWTRFRINLPVATAHAESSE